MYVALCTGTLRSTTREILISIQTCAIPDALPFQSPLDIRRRITLVLTETYQNARLAELARAYDVLAVRPVDERTFALACKSLDCDLISPDLTQRFTFFFPHKLVAEAVKSGKRFEICYAQALQGDAQARRNLIQNATQLIRACRGRGVVISGAARAAVACRGPWDVVNLGTVWGLGQERGVEALGTEARSVLVTAGMKRTSYRGVVDVVYGGDKPAEVERKKENGKNPQLKRKAEDAGMDEAGTPLSKTQMKKRAKQAKIDAAKTEQK